MVGSAMHPVFTTRSFCNPLPGRKTGRHLATLAVPLLPGAAQAANAARVVSGCMQDIAGTALNCTADDVQIAGVAKNPDGSDQLVILDDGCAYPGDTVTFTATFNVVVTGKERHHVGIYFVTDGDLNHDGTFADDDGSVPATPSDSPR